MPSATSSPALPSRSARTAVASVLRRSLTVMGLARACWTIRTTAALAGSSVRPGTTARLHLSPVSPSAHQSNRVSETDRLPQLLAQRPGSWGMRNYENSGSTAEAGLDTQATTATGPRMWALVCRGPHALAGLSRPRGNDPVENRRSLSQENSLRFRLGRRGRRRTRATRMALLGSV